MSIYLTHYFMEWLIAQDVGRTSRRTSVCAVRVLFQMDFWFTHRFQPPPSTNISNVHVVISRHYLWHHGSDIKQPAS